VTRLSILRSSLLRRAGATLVAPKGLRRGRGVGREESGGRRADDGGHRINITKVRKEGKHEKGLIARILGGSRLRFTATARQGSKE